MSIAINNIVDVNFKIITQKDNIGSYSTTIYIVPHQVLTEDFVLCHSYEEVVSACSDEHIRYNAEIYFNNGGVKLVLAATEDYTKEGFIELINNIRNSVNDFIYVVLSNRIVDKENYLSFAEFAELVEYTNSDNIKPPNTFRLVITTNSKTTIETMGLSEKYVAVKYTTKTYGGPIGGGGMLIDAGILIGAFFSKIDLNGSNTIQDYCYTPESFYLEEVTGNAAAEDLSQADYEELVNGNYNFIEKVGNRVVNFGGNYANGVSLHTDFGAIAVENDLAISVLNTIIGKQYLNNVGLSAIVAAINSQLQRYKTNGYLALDSLYSGEDKFINYNGRTFEVVKHNEVLTQGYTVFAVPIEFISVEDKAKKKFTPIFVPMETLAGARIAEIQGEIR